MSLNWVMRAQGDVYPPFILLENESLKYSPSEPIDIKLKPLQLSNPEVITIKGRIYLTTHRVVVLSDDRSDKANDNFGLLFKDIQSYKLEMPWFGNNKFQIVFKISNPDGGLNYLYSWLLNVNFASGGAIRFSEEFGKVKTGFDNDQVDELPAYSE